MRYIATGLLAFALFTAPSAKAEWVEASSDHFLIYADEDEKTVKEFAERLELYHSLLELALGFKPLKPSASNRVTIFALANQKKVRELYGMGNSRVMGFYLPRAGASVAVIPRLKRSNSKYEMTGEVVLYHEYAHHFMYAGFPSGGFPRWFVEGFAEFYSGVSFDANGKVKLGVPPYFRAGDLAYGRKVPIREFLDFDGSTSVKGDDSFYMQSWMLFHYLQMGKERPGQFRKYLTLLQEGRTALEAAEVAFGDLKELEKDMDAYVQQRRLSVHVVDQSALSTGSIFVRQLRPGEAAIMPVKIESMCGVNREEALALVPMARKIAERFPDEPVVLAALTEAEYDAGNDDTAIAAADRALAIDPKNMNALIQKGYALRRKVSSGALPTESWNDVRRHFVQANKVENDNPIPLIQFYYTFLSQNQPPTENAITGLEWAMQLAPFDASLRWQVVQQMVTDERFAEAARTLAPLAYSPHPGRSPVQARELLKEIEAKLSKPTASNTTVE